MQKLNCNIDNQKSLPWIVLLTNYSCDHIIIQWYNVSDTKPTQSEMMWKCEKGNLQSGYYYYTISAVLKLPLIVRLYYDKVHW